MTRDWRTLLGTLDEREAAARAGGGAERLDAHRAGGRLTARERIERLVDAGSFAEDMALAEHRCRDFGMDGKRFPGDGVVTGTARIDGRVVCVYAEDATVFGGSNGRVHGTKIHTLLRRAREVGAPVIGLHDSGGARIQEGMDNVYGMTGMFAEFTRNSGLVPQIVAIMGTCAGGAAYCATLADFIVQVSGSGQLFVTGPALVEEVLGERVTAEALGGVGVHAQRSGVTHRVASDDADALAQIRTLLGYLPQHRGAPAPRRAAEAREAGSTTDLLALVPTDADATYDIRPVIAAIADRESFFELQPTFAVNLVVGFARLDGRPIGVVANNPAVGGGYLDADAAVKAARFVRTCDCFGLPIVTLVDAPGFMPGVAQEAAGLLRHGAKLLHAWVEASVPKVACILKKMYGGVIPAMGVHQIGFDRVYAWPSAEMQMVRAEPAVRILFRRELAAAADPAAELARRVAEYHDLFLTPYHAASLGVVDAVIRPQDTRSRLIDALRVLDGKRDADAGPGRHGNIPL